MKIRRALKEDSKKIFDAHMRSIKEVCSKDYTPEQIAAWGGRKYNPDSWPEIIQKSYVWVIADTTNIFGLMSLLLPESEKTAYITSLYIVPEALGNGFGKQFIKIATDTAKSEGYSKIFADSTTTARNFYISQGFVQVGSINNCMINGKPIEGYPMELKL